MESNVEGNLLEVMDLARTLRQEQLFIQHEQTAFTGLIESLAKNSSSITKLAYICAQQRQNLNDLIIARPDVSPASCCRRAGNFETAKFVDAKKLMDYEHVIAYEEFFNHLYRSPYLLAMSLSIGDRISEISQQHVGCVIHTLMAALYGNAINTRDVEMILKLLRELIEIQIVASDSPRHMLRANSSAFARLYHCLNETLFSAKIFLTAALFEPIMKVLVGSETPLDVDPNKVIQSFTTKERFKRFGDESSDDYEENVKKFHCDTIAQLYTFAKGFVDSLTGNWSLFPSTLRWLVQTICHHLKQAHFSEKIINEILTDMVFTHFICPAVVSPDIAGIIDAPISENVRSNLIQIGQIIQMLALSKHENVESKFTEIYTKFESNTVTNLIDLLLVSRTGEDVVAILSQQSDFERAHLLSTQTELNYLVEFFKILLASDEFDVPLEDRDKLKKILSHLPDGGERHPVNGYDIGAFFAAGGGTDATSSMQSAKDRPKQSLLHIGKATKNKIAHCISFNSNGDTTNAGGGSSLTNGNLSHCNNQAATAVASSVEASATWSTLAPASTLDGSANSSPVRTLASVHSSSESEPILVFNMYNSGDNKLRPLTEEEVVKMNSIGQEMSNGDAVLGVDGESCNLESTIDKSSIANAFDGIDGMSDDVMRPLHAKQTRFSLSHDDGSIGNSDILEAVSEAPSNHSVTSSLELEENDQNDNLSDMVSANVSGRGTPNISGRDTPSSQVTDGGSINNALPTTQMQKLLSKARSDIDDKFCKFEIKKLIEGDETVSIISDTWSTDVLASDSENLDTSERERDRNFSTPLIPSAVVLPGDNNFDVLSGSGAGRATYLDASDQRSESNWSTDVLASDSEKVDTDDNLSLTARSDITDASGRLEGDRERLEDTVATEDRRTDAASCPDRRDDHLSCCERGDDNNCDDMSYNCYGNSPASGAPRRDDSPRSVGGNDSDRSQEDSAFFDAVNSYEDASGLLSAAANISDDVTGSNLSSAASLHYQRLTTMARSSNRAPSGAHNDENNFQQNYKSACVGVNRETGDFPVKQRMRRQTSAESIISNQSLTIDEAATATVVSSTSTGTGISVGLGLGLGIGTVVKTTATTKTGHHGKATTKKRNNSQNAPAKHTRKQCTEQSKDLIEFSDSGDVEAMSPTLLNRDGSDGSTERQLLDVGTDDIVICRRLSSEQRSTAFDGRRNGMLEARPQINSAPPLRRHQSLTYENHEIINATAPKRISVIPSLKTYAQTDDYKNNQQQTQQQQQQQQQKQQEQQQEMLLVVKTRELHLNDSASAITDDGSGGGGPLATITKGVAITAEASAGADVMVAMPTNHRPTKSTGAIPKSISFDSSADKNNASSNSIRSSLNRTSQRLNNDASAAGSLRQFNATTAGNSSIFNKLKQGFFRHRRSNKSARHSGVNVVTTDDFATIGSGNGSGSGRIVSFSNATTTDGSADGILGSGATSSAAVGGMRSAVIAGAYSDISDDILAKYRRKVSTSSETTNSDSTGNIFHVISKNTDDDVGGGGGGGETSNAIHSDKAILYTMIKKKIRTVLSRTDLHTDDYRHTTYSNDTPLLAYLHVQLAQAMNLKNFQQISYVSEAIRCLSTLESGQQQKLLKELQHDIQKRQNYLQYLMRYHQNLLMIMENIKQFEMRLQTESITCNRYLMGACVRLFLEKRESKIEAFQQEFAHINVSDDKIDLIEEFIDDLMEELLSAGGMLNGMPEWQSTEARLSIERILLRRMYQQVMFPNEDADLSRDTVLSDHIRKLQKIIHPSHPALCIAQEYLAEAPWTFAQQQLSYISAYNTPREKLQCVVRCISSIMSLLHMSSGRVPAADDLLPVLIYVVIMANPPYLLSTIEYISCFLGDKLEGEAQFHWTIFGSVVKFIKTMDYLD